MTSICRVPDCGQPTDAFLCRQHGTEMTRALRSTGRGDPDIPTLLAALADVALGRTAVYRAARRRTVATDTDEPEPSEWDELEEEYATRLAQTPAHLRSSLGRITLPTARAAVNLDARDLFDEAWNLLGTWARHLLETRGADPSDLPDPCTPRSLADWLADRVNSFRHDEAGPEAHRQLLAMRERLLRAVDRSASRIYCGPCHVITEGVRCERPLYAWLNVWRANVDADERDDRTVICDGYRPPNDKQFDPTDHGCCAEHTPTDRLEWIIAELDGRLDTLDFWQYWLPLLLPALTYPSRSTWWRWRETSRLVAVSIDRDARELFRGGDVIDLVTREQPRIRGNAGKRARLSA